MKPNTFVRTISETFQKLSADLHFSIYAPQQCPSRMSLECKINADPSKSRKKIFRAYTAVFPLLREEKKNKTKQKNKSKNKQKNNSNN